MQSVFLGHTDEPFTFIYKGKYAVQVTKHSAYVDAIVENLCQSGVTAHNFTPNSPIAGWLTIEKTTTCEDVTLSDVQAEIRTFLQGVGLANIGMQSGELDAPWYEALGAYMPPPPVIVEVVPIEGTDHTSALGVEYDDGTTKVLVDSDNKVILLEDNLAQLDADEDGFTFITTDDVASYSDFETIEIESTEYLASEATGPSALDVIGQCMLEDGTSIVFSLGIALGGNNAVGRMQIAKAPVSLYTITPGALDDDTLFNSIQIGESVDILFNSTFMRITKVTESALDLGVYANADDDAYIFVAGAGKVVNQSSVPEISLTTIKDDFTELLETYGSSYDVNIATRLTQFELFNGIRFIEL